MTETQTPRSAPKKEFTEKWIQALTLAATIPAAQQIKPLFSDLDSLCSQNQSEDRAAAAKRIWDFASPNGLTDLLQITPAKEVQWRFPEEDSFRFESEPAEQEGSLTYEQWLTSLGIATSTDAGSQQATGMKRFAVVTQQDWVDLLRKESIRLKKPMSGTWPEGSLLRMPCTMRWEGTAWSIQFDQPDWLRLKYEEPFFADRPKLADVDGLIWFAIYHASENLDGPKKLINHQAMSVEWIQSSSRLAAFHHQVLETNSKQTTLWFQRVWSCVWPVVYREREVLRGGCDLSQIRTELETCLRTAPKLTLWMFVFARLVCQMQLSSGLGISGDYRD